MTAKVYLTGAGPGDPALLTLKAKQAIENSDVILYDRLAKMLGLLKKKKLKEHFICCIIRNLKPKKL